MLRRTIAEAVTVEIPRVKGSRFIGSLAPVADEAGAQQFVASVRERWPDATHHASAWRVTPDQHRSDDDGEPGGTAGPPLLARLEGHELQGVAVVVTRYYGGTNLGKGGLVRAYGAAASAAVEAATVVEELVRARVSLRCSHSLVGPLQGVASQFEAEVSMDWGGAQPVMHLDVPVEQRDALTRAAIDRSAGRVELFDGAADGPRG